MNLNKSTGYGLIAVCYIAKNQEQKIILTSEISEKYDISLEFLQKIMLQLTKSNTLRSKRGPKGGFSLGKPADKISMLEIIEAVEGPMAGNLYISEQAPNEKFCIKFEKAYGKGIDQAKAVLEKIKLSEML